MRGAFRDQRSMFSCVLPEHHIPAKHPLGPIRELVLNGLSRSPNRLKIHTTVVLQSRCSIRLALGSDAIKHLNKKRSYNLLSRCFSLVYRALAGRPDLDPPVFTNNREGCRKAMLFRPNRCQIFGCAPVRRASLKFSLVIKWGHEFSQVISILVGALCLRHT
jgi:hypothetical protein